MKRVVTGIGVAAALAIVPAGSASASARAPRATGVQEPRAQLLRPACTRALAPANRSISVQAVMRPLAGTQRLQLKFDLLERPTPPAGGSTGTPSQTGVHAGDLGSWISPANPTLGQRPGDLWRLNKAVFNLDAPAQYRLRVTFRWLGANGQVLGTAVRLSPLCRQPELRPDLLVQSLTVAPDPVHPRLYQYTAVIADNGATGAGPFQVLFTPGDQAPPVIRTVTFLGAHQKREMTFEGTACDPADPPTLTVDSADQIDDYDRTNNEMTALCPATS